jgi:indolepyruvate ferredoxin oxidoreductase
LQRRIDADIPVTARELVRFCVTNLVEYQSVAYATTYLDQVVAMAKQEPSGRSELTMTVARELHHLMAYKDEYEVARLHLANTFAKSVRDQFGDGADRTFLLLPPLLERFGLHRKIGLNRSAMPAFHVLAAARRVRGTRLDPFGYTAHRRLERALVDDYRTQIRTALAALDAAPTATKDATYDAVVSTLALANQIRGFDHVKERNVASWRVVSAQALADLARPLTSTH